MPDPPADVCTPCHARWHFTTRVLRRAGGEGARGPHQGMHTTLPERLCGGGRGCRPRGVLAGGLCGT